MLPENPLQQCSWDL